MSANDPDSQDCPVCRELESLGAQVGLDVSRLPLDDKSIALILRSLAFETQCFALSCGIFHHTVESQLHLARDVLSNNLESLLLVGPIVAIGTSDHCGVRINFSLEAYLRLAVTAKDRVRGPIDGDGNV